jgi:hypothetical protein
MRKRFLIIAVALIAVLAAVLAVSIHLMNQAENSSHMYPQSSFNESSNLSVKGVVTSIEENHKSEGYMVGSYHTFRLYIRLNITEVMWVAYDHAEYIHISTENNTVMGWDTICIGYDNLDNPQLVLGQAVECKGYYEPRTDFEWSFIITVSPSISESYLKQQT